MYSVNWKKANFRFIRNKIRINCFLYFKTQVYVYLSCLNSLFVTHIQSRRFQIIWNRSRIIFEHFANAIQRHASVVDGAIHNRKRDIWTRRRCTIVKTERNLITSRYESVRTVFIADSANNTSTRRVYLKNMLRIFYHTPMQCNTVQCTYSIYLIYIYIYIYIIYIIYYKCIHAFVYACIQCMYIFL